MHETIGESMRFTALGVECEVMVHAGDRSEALAVELLAPWAWCEAVLSPAPELRLDVLLSTDQDETSIGFSRGWLVAGAVDELADRLTGLITREAIGLRRETHLMLHAGAVADADSGLALAFIGPSGRGKTTATIALARQFSYLSDETVAVEEDRRVLAYPKPLSIKTPGESWKRQTSPAELALQEPPQVAPTLRTLLLLDRRGDHRGPAVLTPVSLSDVIDEIVPQISYLPARDKPLQRLARLIADCGGLQRVRYAEADSLVPLVRDLLQNPLAAFEPASASAHAASATSGVGVAGQLWRAPVDDAISDDGNVIVLAHGTVTVLAGIAPTIWKSLAEPRSVAEVTADVIAEYGRPAGLEPSELVRSAIAELVTAGLVHEDSEPGANAANADARP